MQLGKRNTLAEVPMGDIVPDNDRDTNQFGRRLVKGR